MGFFGGGFIYLRSPPTLFGYRFEHNPLARYRLLGIGFLCWSDLVFPDRDGSLRVSDLSFFSLRTFLRGFPSLKVELPTLAPLLRS